MTYWTAEELRGWAEGLAGAIEQGERVVSVDLLHGRLGSDDYTFRVEWTEEAWLAKVKAQAIEAAPELKEQLDAAFERARKEVGG